VHYWLIFVNIWLPWQHRLLHKNSYSIFQFYNPETLSHVKMYKWETFVVVFIVFSERELAFTFAICRRASVCLSVVLCLSVTFMHPTQAIEIFRDIVISYERSFILVF